LHQDHVAASLNLLTVYCYQDEQHIGFLTDKDNKSKSYPASIYLAQIFQSDGLNIAIKWRICGLITALATTTDNDRKRRFAEEFHKQGGVAQMMTELKLEKNTKTMFSMFCALCDLSYFNLIMKDIMNNNSIGILLLNVYTAIEKRLLRGWDFIDALLQRLCVLIKNSHQQGPRSNLRRIIKSDQFKTFKFLKRIIFLDKKQAQKEDLSELRMYGLVTKALSVMNDLAKDDPKAQSQISEWIEPFFTQLVASNHTSTALGVATLLHTLCYKPKNEQNIALVEQYREQITSLYNFFENQKRQQTSAVHAVPQPGRHPASYSQIPRRGGYRSVQPRPNVMQNNFRRPHPASHYPTTNATFSTDVHPNKRRKMNTPGM